MAVRLRLMRGGKKKQPTYRVVAAESSHRRDGRFIEIIGQYDPRQDPSLITIDNTKALRWLRNGAQPSDRVRKLLVISGAWAEFTGEAAPEPVAAPEGRGAAKGAADAAVPPPATAAPALVIEDDHPADTPEQTAADDANVDETAEPETPEPEASAAGDESEKAAEASAADVEAEVEAADADGATAAEESDAS